MDYKDCQKHEVINKKISDDFREAKGHDQYINLNTLFSKKSSD